MKFGRRPRIHNPAVPHLSTLLAGQALPMPPSSCDWSTKLPLYTGAYGNDTLNDCTIAACFHAIQTWTANAGKIDSEPDGDAVLMYEGACGYIPGVPSTDQGGIVQDVLAYWLNTGAPTGWGDNSGRQKLSAFVEIDQRDHDNVKLAIATAGLAYIGFNVPNYLPMGPGGIWDYHPAQSYSIVGGHAVVAVGYNDFGLKVISWGSIYAMSWAFWDRFADEAYMLADSDFIESTGLSPAGLSLADLETAMQGLKWGGGHARWKRRRVRREKRQKGKKSPAAT